MEKEILMENEIEDDEPFILAVGDAQSVYDEIEPEEDEDGDNEEGNDEEWQQ